MSDFTAQAQALQHRLQYIASQAPTQVRGAIAAGVKIVERQVKGLMPWVSGGLSKSVTSTVKGSGNSIIGEVTSNIKYAPFVEFDTKPHVIKPVNAKMLRFPIGNKLIRFKSGVNKGNTNIAKSKKSLVYAFAFEVHHPGTRGQHIFKRGLEKSIPLILTSMDAIITNLMTKG